MPAKKATKTKAKTTAKKSVKKAPAKKTVKKKPVAKKTKQNKVVAKIANNKSKIAPYKPKKNEKYMSAAMKKHFVAAVSYTHLTLPTTPYV